MIANFNILLVHKIPHLLSIETLHYKHWYILHTDITSYSDTDGTKHIKKHIL